MFSNATRRSIASLKREFDLLEKQEPDGPSARLLHLAYQAARHDELAGMTLNTVA